MLGDEDTLESLRDYSLSRVLLESEKDDTVRKQLRDIAMLANEDVKFQCASPQLRSHEEHTECISGLMGIPS
jgi:hypothetical protein